MSNKTTLTEKTLQALIGKTFTHYCEGEAIAQGMIVGMVGPNALLLELFEEDPESYEIQPATDLGYDRIAKTGYKFSKDNPYRAKLID
jgi:hypothetical protein